MAKLFGVDLSTVNEHLTNIYTTSELNEISTIRKFPIVQLEGNREVTRQVNHYSLEAIIAVGFRISSNEAINFRKWANQVIKDFTLKGYVLDDVRLKNGSYLNKEYFKDLILQIRDIRQSERNFYQQITDIYATSLDYNLSSPTTREFFATVQNKMHYATHGNTAAELVIKRANHETMNMGLTNWKNAPSGKIIKSDVVIAKNYLSSDEVQALNRIVTMYLDYAEDQANKGVPMTMADWAKKLNAFLAFNDREILENAGKVTAAIAKEFAESEFEKYRPIQDINFESDFDREVKRVLQQNGVE
ncbi:MAG: virulence RhuM family protein [Burkholderiales bacterium]|nr:virulence RhuM family protein [Burkholderiales bacterium]